MFPEWDLGPPGSRKNREDFCSLRIVFVYFGLSEGSLKYWSEAIFFILLNLEFFLGQKVAMHWAFLKTIEKQVTDPLLPGAKI